MYTKEVKIRKAKKVWMFFLLFPVFLGGVILSFMTTDLFDTQPLVSTPLKDAVYLDQTKSPELRATDLLSYMTLEEKIGQMTLVEKDSLNNPSDIKTYHLGALLSGSGSKPPINTIEGWREMIVNYQAVALGTRLSIPLLYGADAIHGHGHVPEATIFPHAIGLGATNNEELVRRVGEATAKELQATGVNWSFSPNLDQPQDIRWGRVYEAFGADPTLVSKLGVAYLEGMQMGEESGKIFVLATPKHYLGLGGMLWGSSLNKNFKIDQGVTPADESVLRSVYLPPFKAVVEAGALSIMAGLNTWGDERMARQKHLLTGTLKDELGFKGFVVSDWYGVHEGQKNTFFATVRAVNAGVDMVMLPFDYETFLRHMKWANRLGLISDERIDDAVYRILYAKFALGLFDQEDNYKPTELPSVKNRALAREAVTESLVLLKNENGLLPINKNIRHIRVAGSAADNVGMQMGGWSVEWQGIDGNWLPGATSILAGIKAEAGLRAKVEYDKLGNFTEGKMAEIGIAVVGETPYAEGWGDREYPILSSEDLEAIKKLQASSQKVVVIIVSGRPLLITNEIDSWDALVAAWLPGSEGVGVSDVLFGEKSFSGTLPLPWPRHAEQLPITSGGETSDNTSVLFPRSFGLEN